MTEDQARKASHELAKRGLVVSIGLGLATLSVAIAGIWIAYGPANRQANVAERTFEAQTTEPGTRQAVTLVPGSTIALDRSSLDAIGRAIGRRPGGTQGGQETVAVEEPQRRFVPSPMQASDRSSGAAELHSPETQPVQSRSEESRHARFEVPVMVD